MSREDPPLENPQAEPSPEGNPESRPVKISSQQSPSSALDQTELDVVMCARRAVEKTIHKMCGFSLQDKPRVQVGDFVRWQNRVRIIKPFECAFVSVMTFRHSHVKYRGFEVHGLLALYLPEETAMSMISALGLFLADLDEYDIRDGCGEFLNVMTGAFKMELVKEGYGEFEVGTPHNFGPKVDELFDYKGSRKIDLIFSKEGKPFMQMDIGIGNLKKIRERPEH